MKEYLCLRIPLRREMMTTVRLATGGVCSAAGMSYDGGESLLLLMRRGFSAASVCFSAAQDGGMQVRVTGEEGAAGLPPSDEDEIALALLNALASDVAMDRTDGAPGAIAFVFGQQA